MDRLGRSKDIARIFALGALIGAVVFVPAIAAPLAPSLGWTWVLLAAQMLIGPSLFTIGTAAVAQLSPTGMVGKITAIHFAWVGIVGTAIGPTLVAVISDRMFTGPTALAKSLSLVAASMSLIACAGYSFLRLRSRRTAAAGLPGMTAEIAEAP